MEQLRGIYNGSIGNWAQVGGPDLPITLYGRLNTSGTYIFFQEHVLQNGPYAPAMIQLVGNSAILNAVTNDPSAIGYVGLGYAAKAQERVRCSR